MITITRWGARNWAVKVDGQLLVVAVYKRGALAEAERISELTGKAVTAHALSTAIGWCHAHS